MTDQWWAGLSPVDCAVSCGSSTHHLTWAEGRLTALDHPDADRERALAALGAEPFPCLDLLDAWERHQDDLDVLVRASRGSGDVIGHDDPGGVAANNGVFYGGRPRPAPRPGILRGRRPSTARYVGSSQSVGWTMYAPPSHRQHNPAGADSGAGLDQLLRLDGVLSDRLAAGVIDAWSTRIAAHDERVEAALPQLRAAVYGRFATALRNWMGRRVDLRLTIVDEGDDPSVTRDEDGIDVRVAFSWLREVWSRDLTTIFGQFCLAAEQVDETTWRLRTLSSDFSAIGTMTIALDPAAG